jgi:hypothetical protein
MLTLSVGATKVATLKLPAARSFVHLAPLSAAASSATQDYVPLTVAVSPASPVAIEQFDASASRGMAGFGDGWHEPEYHPVTGRRWRWLSSRGELHLSRPMTGPSVLHMEGESPRRYFDRPSRLVVRWRDRILFDQSLSDDFSVDVVIPHEAATGAVISVETDQTFVPAEQSRRTRDRRQLGLRIFTCELRGPVPAS